MNVRPEMVKALMSAAADGMMPLAQEATSDEVLSAYFTMLLAGIEWAMENGADPQSIEGPLMEVWAHIRPSGPVH